MRCVALATRASPGSHLTTGHGRDAHAQPAGGRRYVAPPSRRLSGGVPPPDQERRQTFVRVLGAAMALGVALVFLLGGCGKPATTPLRVFHADSLARPFQQMEQAFEREHPGVDVQRESYGSAVAIRQVTELGRPADLIASADYLLIDHMMIAGGQAADWDVLFARNAIVIAWLDPQKALTAENWADVLARDETRVGMSDPNQDPAGYRTLFAHLPGREGARQGGALSRSSSSTTRTCAWPTRAERPSSSSPQPWPTSRRWPCVPTRPTCRRCWRAASLTACSPTRAWPCSRSSRSWSCRTR